MLSYRKISRVGLITLVVLFFSVMLRDSVRADSPYRNTQSWTGPGPGGTPITITFSTPGGPSGTQEYTSCTSASDLLITSGVPNTWTLNGHVDLYSGFLLLPQGHYGVNQSGDLNLPVYYPPFYVLPGATTKTVVADLAITVMDATGTPVSWVGPNGTGVIGPGQNWTVICPSAPVPAISITKYTNGLDANDPNGSGVPRVAAGVLVTWTYKLTNTGTVPVAKTYLSITDNQPGVTPTFSQVISGNNDQVFDPGEVWQYSATGQALDLSVPQPGVTTVPNSCTENKTRPPSTAYVNTGTAILLGGPFGGPFSSDVSSYCNPPPNVPAISVVKSVSVDNQLAWHDANTAPGPTTFVNTNVFFKFRVTNVGSFTLSPITLTDDTYSTSSCSIPPSMATSAFFECIIGPFPAVLGQHTNTATVTGNWTSGTVSDHDSANYFGKLYFLWLPFISK